MLYVLTNGVLSYEQENAADFGDSIAIISHQDMMKELQEQDEFDRVITAVLSNDALRFENHHQMDVMCFHIHTNTDEDMRHAVHVFLQAHSLWIVSDQAELLDEQIKRLMMYDLNTWTLPKVLYHFINRFLEDEGIRLDRIQKEILDLEDIVITNHGDDYTISQIITLRKRLLRQERAYEQAEDAMERLLLNDNQLLSENDLRSFTLLHGRCERLSGRVSSLQDYVTEIREAYQATVDINLNVTMRIFTVITAVFLPLTLIAGWYGMNLQMPEYALEYGYPIIICVSILITVCLLVYFKRHKWY